MKMPAVENWKKYRDNLPTSPTPALHQFTLECVQHFRTMDRNNRNVSEQAVAELTSSALRGEWEINSHSIGVTAPTKDDPGTVNDGQHRLRAWEAALTKDPTLEIFSNVMYGLSPEAQRTTDTVRIRRVRETLRLEGSSLKNPTRSVSFTGMCARLAARTYVPMRTVDSFERWHEPFKKGVEAMVESIGSVRGFEHSQISGALAFAYKANPELVLAFANKLKTGENLKAGDPALTLMNYLRKGKTGALPRGKDSLSLAKRVLNCVLADMQGVKLDKCHESDHGLEYFRTIWDTPKMRELCEDYMPRVHAINDKKRAKMSIDRVRVPGAIEESATMQ